MEKTQYWSRLAGFFAQSLSERRHRLLALPLDLKQCDFTAAETLSLSDADLMSENVVATLSLPFSIAANFIVDSQPVIVPMATEEPSIVAACSKMAKLVSSTGGFYTSIDRPLLKGQIQLYGLRDSDKAVQVIEAHKQELLEAARRLTLRMNERGGGIVAIDARMISSPAGPMLIVEPLMDVVDAMGANAINTFLEQFSLVLSSMIECQIGLRILSNYCDQRLAHARCAIPFSLLATDSAHDCGLRMAKKIEMAHAFAEADVYRACTHNKGILNGIDAVALATGNDFRAIEAAAHTYASRSGAYKPLTSLTLDEENHKLEASLSLPLAVGVVGGMLSHSGVKLAHKLLGEHAQSSRKLAAVMVSVGLAQTLAAMYSLSDEGIQKGHMKLHRKKLDASRSP